MASSNLALARLPLADSVTVCDKSAISVASPLVALATVRDDRLPHNEQSCSDKCGRILSSQGTVLAV